MRAAFAFVVILFLAPAAGAGITYRMEQVTQGVRPRTFAGVAKIESGKSRFEVTRNDNSKLFETGSVILSTTGSHVMTVLEPAKKTYYILDLDQIGKALEEAQKQLRSFLSSQKPTISIKGEGDGGIVEGFPTKKWLVTIATRDTGTLTMHVWTTDRIPTEAADAFQNSDMPGGTPLADALRIVRKQMTGFPLKSDTTTKMVMSGSTSSVTSTMKVTQVRSVNIAPAEFEMPAGYTKVDSPIDGMLGAIGAR